MDGIRNITFQSFYPSCLGFTIPVMSLGTTDEYIILETSNSIWWKLNYLDVEAVRMEFQVFLGEICYRS